VISKQSSVNSEEERKQKKGLLAVGRRPFESLKALSKVEGRSAVCKKKKDRIQ